MKLDEAVAKHVRGETLELTRPGRTSRLFVSRSGRLIALNEEGRDTRVVLDTGDFSSTAWEAVSSSTAWRASPKATTARGR